MEAVIFLSIIIALFSILVSCFAIRRVKKQIAEITDALIDVKNGNGNRRILSATNELVLSILLGLCNSFVTIIVGIIACRENMTLSTIIIGTIQICGMALFTFIGEMPLIAHCGKKQNSFKGGAVAAFLLGYISIYFKNPIIRNLYPLSAGLSIVGFNGEGFVTDTTGAYSSSQSILLGVLTMLAMLILSLIIISIPQKETLATPLSQKRRKTERKIAK